MEENISTMTWFKDHFNLNVDFNRLITAFQLKIPVYRV